MCRIVRHAPSTASVRPDATHILIYALIVANAGALAAPSAIPRLAARHRARHVRDALAADRVVRRAGRGADGDVSCLPALDFLYYFFVADADGCVISFPSMKDALVILWHVAKTGALLYLLVSATFYLIRLARG